MKITGIDIRPLRIPYRQPFHWAQGEIDAAEVLLVEVRTDEGVTGYGECMTTASPEGVLRHLEEAAALCVGADPFAVNALMARAGKHLFAARGNCSSPRFAALVLAGLDMALWDVMGKACRRPVHALLGGALRERVDYFGFPQGDGAQEIADSAAFWAAQGCKVIYAKIGRGETLDLDIAAKVRAAIGGRRLRLDANESWDALTARRMIRALEPFDIEFLEQPTDSNSLAALAHVRGVSGIPIAADQRVFGPEDAYEVCRHDAADLIVLGLHETGGIERFRKTAAIAEAAGLNICLHGLYETGITTCAHLAVGVTLPNLDDGNQYMNHLLIEDIVSSPALELRGGVLPALTGPGLGFELDWDAVGRAEERYRQRRG